MLWFKLWLMFLPRIPGVGAHRRGKNHKGDRTHRQYLNPSPEMRSCWHLNTQECRNPVSFVFRGNIKSVSIGIIAISILDLCVNVRQSIVICGPRNYIFLTADE